MGLANLLGFTLLGLLGNGNCIEAQAVILSPSGSHVCEILTKATFSNNKDIFLYTAVMSKTPCLKSRHNKRETGTYCGNYMTELNHAFERPFLVPA